MADTPTNTNIRRLEEKLNDTAQDVKDLRAIIEKLGNGYAGSQMSYTREHAVEEQALLTSKEQRAGFRIELDAIKAAHKLEFDAVKLKLEVLEESNSIKFVDLEKLLAPLLLQSKIIHWVAAILGASTIALIWAILTHSIEIVSP
jgi:hypothetical protein